MTGIREAKNLPFNFEPDPMWLPVTAILEKTLLPEDLLATRRQSLSNLPNN